MLRLILIYASSAGLQRAIVFLATPFLSRHFSLDDLGGYTIVQAGSQLLIPVLTWNTTVALTREANDHPADTSRLLRLVARSAALIGAIALLLVIPGLLPPLFAITLMLGSTEAAFASAVAALQGREAATTVLTISTLKTLIFVGLIALVVTAELDLYWLLSAQVVNGAASACAAVYLANVLLTRTEAKRDAGISVRQMVAYSAATLPHTVALWVSMSADRLFLGLLQGKETVGSYVLAYTVAQGMLLMTVGIIAALPPRVARAPDTWRSSRNVIRFVYMTAAAALSMGLALLAFLHVNRQWYVVIPRMPDNAPLLVALISSGFYCSIYYVLFASYMYLNRRTEALARSGFYLAPLNVVVMALLVFYMGPAGAAVGLLFSYAAFGVTYGHIALRLEPSLKPAIPPILAAGCLLTLILLAASMAMG